MWGGVEVFRSCIGHCVLSVVCEILWGLVILVCSGNRSIPKCVVGLDRFNPLCGNYGVLRWFFKLGQGVGQSEGVPSIGNCVPVSRAERIMAKNSQKFYKNCFGFKEW